MMIMVVIAMLVCSGINASNSNVSGNAGNKQNNSDGQNSSNEDEDEMDRQSNDEARLISHVKELELQDDKFVPHIYEPIKHALSKHILRNGGNMFRQYVDKIGEFVSCIIILFYFWYISYL